MKIKQILTSENNFGPITSNKNNSFSRIEKFLKSQDPICCENYYRNKETLTIFLLTKMNFEQVSASYMVDGNIIYISDFKKDLTHELMHMTSTQIIDDHHTTFSTHKVWDEELQAIDEGLTEFLASLIDNKPIETYGIQSFAAKMLYTTTNGGIVVPYTTADGQSFIDMFNPCDIHNVILNLAVFHHHEIFGSALDLELDQQGYVKCFFDMLAALIDTELRTTTSIGKLKQYREIFLSSLEEEIVKLEVEDFSKNYHNRAKKLIDRKLERRR